VTEVISEGFEDGTLGVFTSHGTPGWGPVPTLRHAGNYAALAEDVDVRSNQRLTLNGFIPIPADAVAATLSFWHTYRFDRDANNNYDGGVLEVSINGRTWTDAGANIVSGGYNGTISTCCTNPLAGRDAWVRNNPQYTEVVVDLLPYAGRDVRFRFREGTDESGGAKGWWVDDISVIIAQATCGRTAPRLMPETEPSEPPDATPGASGTPQSGSTPIPTSTPAPLPGGSTATPAPTVTPSPTPLPPKSGARPDPYAVADMPQSRQSLSRRHVS
jgi:hypothetical protein